MRRPGIVPFTFAAAVTVAAGLSLAEEHTRPSPPTQELPTTTASGSLKGTGEARPETKGSSAEGRGTDGTATVDSGQSKPLGVGSRALTSTEAEERAADQPEMATGVDLNGPPVRFPAANTPE